MSCNNFNRTHREPFSNIRASPVKDLQLEYVAFRDDVVPGNTGRPLIIENMIGQKNIGMEVMEGYDPHIASTVNKHSIFHLYKYESMTRFLDHLPESSESNFGFGFGSSSQYNEIPTKFLMCRYVICSIDDSMMLHKPLELLAVRLNGDIYIGSNKMLNEIGTKGCLEAAYSGLNFAKKVTYEPEAKNFEKHRSVVKQLDIVNYQEKKKINLFVSSVARAFDTSGNVVELKTIGSMVLGKLQNLSMTKARSWWLRAFLSGATRIVYGLRMPDLRVNEVHEAEISEFTNGHFKINGNRLFSEMYRLLNKIDRTLEKEGQMCMVTTNGNEPMHIRIVDQTAMKRSPFW